MTGEEACERCGGAPHLQHSNAGWLCEDCLVAEVNRLLTANRLLGTAIGKLVHDFRQGVFPMGDVQAAESALAASRQRPP